MTSTTPTQQRSLRVAWVDNLRVAAITGVIVVHTATAYVADFADWYYDDELHPTTVGFAVFAVPALLGGIFGLGPLFWLAGWFSVRSLHQRGPARFAVSRLVRLGVPLALFVLLVNPMADVMGDLRQERRSFADYLGETEFSIMWFVAALLFCSLAYAGVRAVAPAAPHPRRPGTAAALAAALVIGVLAALTWPVSSLLDEHLMSLRLGAWSQGAVLFTLGVLTGEAAGGSLDEPITLGIGHRAQRGWGWLTVGGAGAIVALVASSDAGDGLDEVLQEMPWQGVVFALVYGVVSVSFSLWCLAWFARRWTGHRPWSERAGRATYATYLLHPLVLTGVMVALWWIPIGPEAKVLLVMAVGAPACFLAGYGLTMMPGVRRVL